MPLFCVLLSLHPLNAYFTLKQLSYTKLPASTKNDFRLFSGTAEEGAFDWKQAILYVVGESYESRHEKLHVWPVFGVSDQVRTQTWL